jgi:nuclear transport factor 2 (NTF2) superfamily protein
MSVERQDSVLSEEAARAVLTRSQRAWQDGDLDALVRALDPDIQVLINFAEPISGAIAATEWLQHRFNTQLGYRLNKQLRGVYGSTVVSHWTGTWHDKAGECYRVIGIELLTIGSNGLITRWESVMTHEDEGPA